MTVLGATPRLCRTERIKARPRSRSLTSTSMFARPRPLPPPVTSPKPASCNATSRGSSISSRPPNVKSADCRMISRNAEVAMGSIERANKPSSATRAAGAPPAGVAGGESRSVEGDRAHRAGGVRKAGGVTVARVRLQRLVRRLSLAAMETYGQDFSAAHGSERGR